MRKWLALTAALCLAFTIAVPVAAATDTVRINPFHQETATANVGDTVVLEVGWGACTRGLDQAFTRAAHVEWSIDDVPFPTTPGWTTPVPYSIGEGPSPCMSGTLTGWRTTSQTPTTFEATGTYIVRVVMWTTRALQDGGDYDGDGKPDFFGGPGAPWEAELTLTVN